MIQYRRNCAFSRENEEGKKRRVESRDEAKIDVK